MVVVGGLLLVIIGLLGHRPDGAADRWPGGLKLAPAFLVAGIGGGLVISPNVTLTLAEVDPRRAGSGGGMLQTVQRVGSAIGIAVVLALFFAALATGDGDYARAAVGQPPRDRRIRRRRSGVRDRRPGPPPEDPESRLAILAPWPNRIAQTNRP